MTQAIQSNRKGDFEFILIIEFIGSLLHSFSNFKVKIIKRQNIVANSWTQRNMLISSPRSIEHFLINDLH